MDLDKQGRTGSAGDGAWGPEARERLSALLDGELDPAQAAPMTRSWSGSAQARADWHVYGLIGDALRSDDLAVAGREAAFLQALRVRMADEPVVLAPQPLAAAVEPARPVQVAANGAATLLGAMNRRTLPRPGLARRPRWMQGTAVAAGFAAVVAVLVSLDAPTGPTGPTLASSSGGTPSLPSAAVGVVPVSSGLSVVPGHAGAAAVEAAPMIRDARLDAYLQAHRQLGPAGWTVAPSPALPAASPGLESPRQ